MSGIGLPVTLEAPRRRPAASTINEVPLIARRRRIVGNLTPVLSHCPLGTARMTPLPSWGDPAKVRGRGQTAAVGGPAPRTPWRAASYGQTTARAGWPATSRREREGARGLGGYRSYFV